MYNIPDAYKSSVETALAGDTRELRNRIRIVTKSAGGYVTQKTITTLKTCVVSEAACSSTELSIGGFPTNSANAEFVNDTGYTNFKNRLTIIECGVKYGSGDNDVFYVPLGIFKIDNADTEDDWKTVTIKAYDLSYWWTGTIPANTFSENQTALAAVMIICDACDVDFDADEGVITKLTNRTLTATDAGKLNGMTWRDAAKALAGIVGCNARINSEGKLYFGFFADSGVTVPQTMQWQGGFKKGSNYFAILSVTSNDNEGTNESFTAGSGEGVSFGNPIITHDEIAAILTALTTRAEWPWPCTLEWRGNPCVEAGDMVTVSYKESSYKVFITSQEVDLTGGLSISAQCPKGDEDYNFDTIEYQFKKEMGAIDDAIKEATDRINGAEGGYVEINDTPPQDGNPDEILILSDERVDGVIPADAKVIRMNKNGIGFSNNGGRLYTVAIDGNGITAASIQAGLITGDKIQGNTITANKLSVGDGLYTEMFYNPDMDLNLQTVNWNGFCCDLTGYGSGTGESRYINAQFVKDPTLTNPYYASVEQHVYLKSGQSYMFTVRFTPLNVSESATGNDAFIGMSFGKEQDLPDLYVYVHVTAAEIAAKSNYECTFRAYYNHTSEDGYYNVGFFWEKIMRNSTNLINLNINWASLVMTPKLYDSGRGFWSGTTGSNHIDYIAARKDALKTDAINVSTEGRFTSNGSVYASEGNVGIQEYKDNTVTARGQVSYDAGDRYLRASEVEIISAEGYDPPTETSDRYVKMLENYDSRIKIKSRTAEILSNGYAEDFEENGETILSAAGLYISDAASGNEAEMRAQKLTISLIDASDIDSTHIEATRIDANDVYANVHPPSREALKENIKKAEISALDEVKKSVIYDYTFKTDKKGAKKKYGFVIERETPKALISEGGEAINLYSMASMNWKATQELLQRVEALEAAIQKLTKGSGEK